MTRIPSYNQAITARVRAPYHYAATANIPELVPVESVMPRFLGFMASLYLASVCFFSAAAESVAWVAQAVAVLVGFAWLTIGLVIYGQGVTWTRPITLYLAFLFWSLTGYLVTPDRENFSLILLTTTKVVMISWVMSQCVRTRRDLLVCFLMVAMTSLGVVLIGGDEIRRSASFRGGSDAAYSESRAGSLLGNANDLGMYGVTVVTSAVICLIGYRSLIIRGFALLACAAGLYLVAASGSRTGMLGIAVGSVAIYFYYLRQLGANSAIRKVATLMIALMLMAGTAYYISTLPFFFRVKEMVSSRSSVEREPRLVYFFRSLEAVASSPIFGLGLNGFALNRLGTDSSGQGHYSHSSISETLSATGFIGFGLFYCAFYVLYRQLKKLRKLDIPPKDKAMVNLIMSLLWVIVAFSAVAVLFYHRLIWPILGACSGYVWFLDKQYGHLQPGSNQVAAGYR